VIPTEPGYYQAKPLNHYVSLVPTIVKVVLSPKGELKVEQFGQRGWHTLDEFEDWFPIVLHGS
jgi:hypothetical protein